MSVAHASLLPPPRRRRPQRSARARARCGAPYVAATLRSSRNVLGRYAAWPLALGTEHAPPRLLGASLPRPHRHTRSCMILRTVLAWSCLCDGMRVRVFCADVCCECIVAHVLGWWVLVVLVQLCPPPRRRTVPALPEERGDEASFTRCVTATVGTTPSCGRLWWRDAPARRSSTPQGIPPSARQRRSPLPRCPQTPTRDAKFLRWDPTERFSRVPMAVPQTPANPTNSGQLLPVLVSCALAFPHCPSRAHTTRYSTG